MESTEAVTARPQSIHGLSAWTASDMQASRDQWILRLEDAEIAEFERAGQSVRRAERDLETLAKEEFPLPKFGRRIHGIREALLRGPGIQVLRGLPMHRYTLQEAATIFCGVGAHLGNARPQNAEGHILGHVRDDGEDAGDPNTRIYRTNERQTFHTDSADVVGLMCIRTAKEGGESLLVSAVSIYNRMNAERPDLLALLFDPIATDRRGEIPEGAAPFVSIPVFSWYRGFLTVFYQRQYIDSAQRFSGAMRLTPRHVEALDLFDTLANDPGMHVRMQLQPGDMQFVYNHSMLHDRTAFVDWPDPAKCRHLLRLWLSVPGDRPLPTCFRERYGSVDVGRRGGIVTARAESHTPLT